jgi:hypothetical protein
MAPRRDREADPHGVATLGSGAHLELAAEQGNAFAHPDRAGSLRAPRRGCCSSAVVADLDGDVVRAVADHDLGAGGLGVLQGVGQRLLHDPVERQVGAGGQGPRGAVHGKVHRQPRRPLHARAWLADAARLLNRTPEALAAELVDTMLRGGAIVPGGGRLPAAAEHTPVATGSLREPFPRAWPPTAPTRAGPARLSSDP